MAGSYRVVGPFLRLLSPETAHALSLWALAHGLVRSMPRPEFPGLRLKLWGLDFPTPIGLAAGFDKDARVVDAMLGLGFGFVEVGTVTPRAQPGNPGPRLFRLGEDEAVINRLGFNSEGLKAVAAGLEARRGRSGVVGVNIGKNRDTADDAADYVTCLEGLHGLADYVVVNVSSPNTPGLRELQERERLTPLLEALAAARARLVGAGERAAPLLLKIGPDLSEEEAAAIAEVALAHGLEGLVVSNTTLARPEGLQSRHRDQAGGLSGRPLFARSTRLLAEMYRLTQGRIPLVGVGGVASAADAYAKIRAGASLVQLYTGLVFRGPGLVARITAELAGLLERDGFERVTQAVGADAR